MPQTGGAPRRAHALLLGLLATVVTVVACFTVPALATAATTIPTAERYGINAAGLTGASPQIRRSGFATLAAGGVRLVRFDLSWSHIEPAAPGADGRHKYDWASTDAFVADLARAGLRGYPMIGYSAPWASLTPNDQMSRPRDPAQYATFAAAGVARYGPGGSFWTEHPELSPLPVQTVEVWNEPNYSQFWHEQATGAGDFARLYLAARQAIHAQAPSVEVVAGGLGERDAEAYIRRMFAAAPQLRGALDAIGYHPYLVTPTQALHRLQSVRQTLDSVGASQTAIEVTEVGWSLLDITDAQRGESLAAFSRLTLDPALRVTRVIPYCALSIEYHLTAWVEWLGILNQDGSAKPSFRRWATEIAALPRPAAVLARVSSRTTRASRSARARKARAARRALARRAALRARR